MEELKLYSKCGVCGGDGVQETTSGHQPEVIDPCPSCMGGGYHETGKIDGAEELADLSDKVNDVLDKVNDVLEKLNE